MLETVLAALLLRNRKEEESRSGDLMVNMNQCFVYSFFSCKLGTISDRQWRVLHQKVACATSSLIVLWGGGRKLR